MTPIKTKTGGEEKSPRRSPRFQSKTTLRRSPRLKKRRENKETNPPETRTKSQTKPIKEVRFAKSVDTRLQRINRHWLAANKAKVGLAAVAAVVIGLLFMYKQKS